MSAATVIANDPPNDGRQWDCQCARCGSSMYSVECEACGGEGVTAPGELYEQDPLWYDQDDYEACSQCGGDGAWMVCMSDYQWCLLNPRAGRIEIEPKVTTEWFTLDKPNNFPNQPMKTEKLLGHLKEVRELHLNITDDQMLLAAKSIEFEKITKDIKTRISLNTTKAATLTLVLMNLLKEETNQ